uniref:FDX-ACB domain-containing protein n=1 Tax=candidate division WWE3 bacterium TaxID=2053526 RepID=A0A7C4XGW7_UNCKA
MPSELSSGKLPDFEDNKLSRLAREIKGILSGMGCSEVYNYSFTSAKALMGTGEDPQVALRLKNPISPDLEFMRTNLASSLLRNIALNQDNYKGISIFEIARVYFPNKNDLPKEEQRLCIAIKSGSRFVGQTYFDTKGIIEYLLQKQNISKPSYKKINSSYLDSAQEIFVSGDSMGVIGLVSPKAKDSFGIKGEVSVLEISLESLVKYFGTTKQFVPISKFPTASRDINIVINKNINILEIEKAISESALEHILSFEIQDIYEGKGLPESKKSVTINMVFGSKERTLLDAEIIKEMNAVIKRLECIGGALRE